jgi:two-component system, chemotaxis family, protein-glutamate methylesterase/glutaminase
MINVLVIDDSALIREFMTKILREQPDINVVDSVPNPYKAVDILNTKKIDVILLDLEMPRMDGLTFLEKLMKQRPVPVIVCSSIAEEGSENAMRALDLGAIEIISKAKLGVKDFILSEKEKIIDSVRSASGITLGSLKKLSYDFVPSEKPVKIKTGLFNTTNKVIAIGASTGGTVVLRYILTKLPKTVHGIVVTQHMPEGFTKKFSDNLNTECQINIKEAEDNDPILIGNAIIAKGDSHLKVKVSGSYYQCVLSKDKPVNRHRPSVDVMFRTIAEHVGKNALGILLTGMGRDGADGLMSMKEAGANTIAQNEESCTVFGMPKAAIEMGAAEMVLDPDEIIKKIIEFSS